MSAEILRDSSHLGASGKILMREDSVLIWREELEL